jgi:hypothetical protein
MEKYGSIHLLSLDATTLKQTRQLCGFHCIALACVGFQSGRDGSIGRSVLLRCAAALLLPVEVVASCTDDGVGLGVNALYGAFRPITYRSPLPTSSRPLWVCLVF